jgi:hypothetical protein
MKMKELDRMVMNTTTHKALEATLDESLTSSDGS